MELSQHHGLSADEGQAYNLMAQMLATQLRVPEAQDWTRRADEVARDDEPAVVLAERCATRSMVLGYQGPSLEPLTEAQRACEGFEELGHLQGLGTANLRRASALLRRGEIAAARESTEEGMLAISDHRGPIYCLLLGQAAVLAGYAGERRRSKDILDELDLLCAGLTERLGMKQKCATDPYYHYHAWAAGTCALLAGHPEQVPALLHEPERYLWKWRTLAVIPEVVSIPAHLALAYLRGASGSSGSPRGLGWRTRLRIRRLLGHAFAFAEASERARAPALLARGLYHRARGHSSAARDDLDASLTLATRDDAALDRGLALAELAQLDSSPRGRSNEGLDEALGLFDRCGAHALVELYARPRFTKARRSPLA